ncbi:iron-sulfur cluster assembly accessory protein [Domibacillus sp. A3M-37]|uniref:HesB/IscA family protein n=1 Tax=Domibacillus sp. A3M-37 TaxID=2962037 RepID=UPI0020B68E55|nr:iron-sulfur cluster assembly accessory protein [Domibacillus sp. A3M-37]MCP3762880.1 iron-sulfur cluster assembly accessory protein [Domibacillus sp. A3M-37]
MFTITEKAQEKIKEMMQEDTGIETFLTFRVTSRCCNEMEYDLSLSSHKKEQDTIIEFDEFRALINPADIYLIKNTEIDFKDDGFMINNPNPLVSV